MDDWIYEYLGKPYERGANGPDSYDCWGLVWRVFSERFNLTLPHFNPSLTDLDISRQMATDFDGLHGVRDVTDEQYGNFDVALMRRGSYAHHSGLLVYADQWCILHAIREAGVILTPVNSLDRLLLTIHRVYRHEQVLRICCLGD